MDGNPAKHTPVDTNVDKNKSVAPSDLHPDEKSSGGATILHQDVTHNNVDEKTKTTLSVRPNFVCSYCHQSFSHKGSYGRHLDNKKGDALHPHDEIVKMRSSVIRRTGNVIKPPVSKVHKPSLVNSKVASHNPESSVVVDKIEMNKIRRKLRDRHIKSKILTYKWLVDQFGTVSRPSNVSFADSVCLYLPINQWPIRYPDNLCFEQLNSHVTDDDLRASIANQFVEWQSLDQEQKKEAWDQTKAQMISQSIGQFCIDDLGQMKSVVRQREQQLFNQFCEADNLTKYVDATAKDTDETSDGEADEISQFFSI